MHVISKAQMPACGVKHDINKVWLRHLRLHEIVRLRDVAKFDYQPRAFSLINVQSDRNSSGIYVF